MIRRPPRSTRTDTLFPYTTLFRSALDTLKRLVHGRQHNDWRIDTRPSQFGDECQPFTVRQASIQKDCRSEEHTSELQSLMRISYAVFCLKQKTQDKQTKHQTHPPYI